jgi:multidrug efflux pump subunit AcrA (membrane-fusion protein)
MRFTGPVRRRVLWSAGITAVIVALAVVIVMANRSGKPTPVASSTTSVQRGTVTLAVSAAGTIMAANTRGLAFSMAGTLTEVDVKAGDLVTAGQVLAKIDPTDAQASVDSAQSRVNDAQSALDRAEATAALPACPTPTTRPPTTAAPPTTPEPSGSPGASPKPSGSPSPSGTGGGGTGGGGTGGGGTGGGGTSGGTGSHGSGTAGATPTCTTAGKPPINDNLLASQQQFNNAQLTLTMAQTKLAGTTLTAPIAGRVLSVGGKVGGKESPGGTGFIVLGDISNLAASAQFSEADVGRLAVGQVASITLPHTTDPVSGKVSQIDPAGTVSGRLVRYGVVIAFDAVPQDLLLGESATVLVTTATATDVLYAATAAVTGVSNGSGTVTVRANGHDEQRTVKIGLRGDQYTEITSGVSVGDQLVLTGSA